MVEIWKDILGFEGLYQVSDKGQVKSLARKFVPEDTILKPTKDKDGYLRVGLMKDKKRRVIRLHRLVASAFLDNPENKPDVNHKDGNKENNDLSNLEWNTRKENNVHSFETGLNKAKILVGEDARNSKLTEKEVRYIRDNFIKRDKDFGATALAKQFGVTDVAILKIIKRQSWTHII